MKDRLAQHLGQNGQKVPVTSLDLPTPEVGDRLVRLFLAGLESMYEPATETLVSLDFTSGEAVRVSHLSARYTVLCSLGVHQAKAAGYATELDGKRLLEAGLAGHPAEDLDHLAAALWADTVVDAGLAEKLIPRLLASLDRDLSGDIGRVLAWALTALALQMEKGADANIRRAAARLRDIGVNQCYQPSGRLFAHTPGGSGFWRQQALFSTQIYWVYALAAYGRAAQDEHALQIASDAAERLIALRDPFFGWCWRYDAAKGTVTERYPVYAVHQDAMAPMALGLLGEATGTRYNHAIRESLGWLWRNELGLNRVDEERQVIYRAIRRVFPMNRVAYWTGWGASFLGQRSPVALEPWMLRKNATCRPYHLGWLLHAFAGKLGRLEP